MGKLPRILLATLGGLFLVRVWLASSLNMIPDEAYYWSWSKNPSWCYYDQPGMIAWIEFAATRFFGIPTPFLARLPVILLGGGATVATYLLSFDLFGSRVRALTAAFLMNIIPVFFTGGFLVMHDSPLIFFWILSVLVLVRLVKTRNPLYFYLLALTAAAAVYSKFTGVFFFLGLLLFFSGSPARGQWMKNPHLWLGAALSMLVLVPILLWNASHDWVACKAVMKLGAKHPSSFAALTENVGSYHAAQFLLVSPLIFIMLVVSLFLGVRRWIRERDDRYLVCLVFSVPVLLYFSYMSFRTRVQPNWPVFGYPLAVILMIELIGSGGGARSSGLPFGRRFQRWAVGCAAAMDVVLVLHAAFCLIPARFEGLLKKDRLLKELYGWPELAEKAASLQKPGMVLMVLRYQVASELEFYSPGREVFCLNAFGRGNQYDITGDVHTLQGRDVVLVSEQPIPARLASKFRTVESTERCDLPFRGVVVKTFYLTMCRGFDLGRGFPLENGKGR